MTKAFCPGSENIRNPSPDYIPCRKCGEEVEIWSDEVQAKCSNCGTVNYKEKPPACIDWCKFAEQCIGKDAFARLKGPGAKAS